MSKIEKVISGMIVVCILAIGGLIYNTSIKIEEAGGFDQVIIDMGKEIRYISNEIAKE